MSLVRFSVIWIITAVIACPAVGQAPGDSVVISGGAIQEEPFITGTTVFRLSRGDTVRVIGAEENYLEVVYAQPTIEWEGWLRKENVMSAEERKKYEQELEAKRRKAQQRKEKTQGDMARSDIQASEQEPFLSGTVIGVFFIWIASAVLVGWAAKERGRTPTAWFLLSLILSPLVGFIAIIAAGDPTD